MFQDSWEYAQQVPSTPFLRSPTSTASPSRRVPDVGSQSSNHQSTPFLALIFRNEGVPCTPDVYNNARTCPPTPNWTPLLLSSIPPTPNLESSSDIQTVPSTGTNAECAGYFRKLIHQKPRKDNDSLSQASQQSEVFDWFDNPSSQHGLGTFNSRNQALRESFTEIASQPLEQLTSNQTTLLAAHPSRSVRQADRVCRMLNTNFHHRVRITDFFNNDNIFA